MAYLALYRKYRPIKFEDVIGQEHITKTLVNQVKSGNISHAYLFTGSRGVGKTTCAKIFAKAINCLDPQNGSPCGKCECCKALSDPSNVDVLEIDAASNNRVDEIRELREKIGYTPVSCKYKVYIIDEVHMLTDSAFNALLKTLEEPPRHAVFVLATTEPHKLPATILSRCMRFDFKLVSIEMLVELLENVFKSEGVTIEKEAARVIAVKAEGGVRDCLSIAECVASYCDQTITLEKTLEVLGVNDRETLFELANAVNSKDTGKALETIDKVCTAGKNISAFARDLCGHFRDLIVAKTCVEPNKILNLTKDTYEKLKAQADSFELNSLYENMKIFSGILAELKFSISPRVLVESAVVESISGINLSKKN